MKKTEAKRGDIKEINRFIKIGNGELKIRNENNKDMHNNLDIELSIFSFVLEAK
ncbi:hypothetical protein ACR71G_00005 [Xenorhabdus bovienii]|uniref:hypothetical protein n=1 Tax=Xenorhabdus bovienii TaxID=40576 RepID=UPI003DA1FC4E